MGASRRDAPEGQFNQRQREDVPTPTRVVDGQLCVNFAQSCEPSANSWLQSSRECGELHAQLTECVGALCESTGNFQWRGLAPRS